jgi:uncharacterized protein YjbI with pentapeptide repeats
MPTGPRPPLIDSLRLAGLDEADDAVLRKGATLEGIRIGPAEIDGRDLSDLSTSECVLDGLTLRDSSVRRARFSETRIARLDVAGLDAAHTTWRFCELDGVRIGSGELFDSEWQSVRVRDSKLGYLNLRGAQLHDVEFVDCRIDELDLQGATLQRVSFQGCHVDTLVLRQASLRDVELRGARLTDVQGVDNLRGVVVSADQLADLAPLLAAHPGITIA